MFFIIKLASNIKYIPVLHFCFRSWWCSKKIAVMKQVTLKFIFFFLVSTSWKLFARESLYYPNFSKLSIHESSCWQGVQLVICKSLWLQNIKTLQNSGIICLQKFLPLKNLVFVPNASLLYSLSLPSVSSGCRETMHWEQMI